MVTFCGKAVKSILIAQICISSWKFEVHKYPFLRMRGEEIMAIMDNFSAHTVILAIQVFWLAENDSESVFQTGSRNAAINRSIKQFVIENRQTTAKIVCN